MATMKAVRIKKFGGPETIAVEDVPRPQPKPGEVLVRVHASSINPMDWKLREGMMKDLPLPFTPGGDFSGVIEELGSGVSDFTRGQEVFGCTPGSIGADAEFLVAPADTIAAKPKSLDHLKTASVPLAAMTGWQALFEHGKLTKGQTVLILGGSGGVGSFAVQFAKAAGAKVIATASTENVEQVRELGADVVIDYKARRVEDEVRNADVCVDLVGGEFGLRAISCVKKGGAMVSTVQPPDQTACGTQGIQCKMMLMRPKAEHLREIARLIDGGKVKVRVAKVMPMHRAAEAEEMNRRHEVEGKIVLQVDGAPAARGKTKIMRAARLVEYKKPFSIDEVPMPEPGPGQVVVKISGAGFCHSDLHVIEGEVPTGITLPAILGHENAGHVSAVGAGVTTVKEGDAVAIYGAWGDGFCDYCVSGKENLCPNQTWIGLSKWSGGYAEYTLVPQERYLVKLSSLDPKLAAPLTDAALTPYHAVRKAQSHLSPDHMSLAIGMGGLGQYGVKFIRLLGGGPVIAVDVSDEKLKMARELGAAHTINGKDPKLVEKVRELTRGRGVAAAFDFVGADATLSSAIASTAIGGKITQVGLAGGGARLKLFENYQFEASFEATLWGSIKELREVIALAESGSLKLNETEFAPLDKINEVHARLKNGQVKGRAVLIP